ncbi:MAG TPA: hypothetical protein DFH99_08485 [Roseburia sp.]|nr:hypothetical protein [Roseburia sp.]HCI27565.1 hypothetical protein [Roseburia sp.]
MKKPSGQDRTASEWNYIARATRRRRRIMQNRILSCRKYCVMSKNEKLNALYEKFSVLSSTP